MFGLVRSDREDGADLTLLDYASHDYSRMEHGETFVAGNTMGTGTIVEASGDPFDLGEHLDLSCLVPDTETAEQWHFLNDSVSFP